MGENDERVVGVDEYICGNRDSGMFVEYKDVRMSRCKDARM